MIIDDIGEFGLINLIKKGKKYIGDDCAVIHSNLLISVDTFIEDIHFSKRYFGYEDIGYKCVGAALSDIAAMAGKPEFYLISLGLTGKEMVKDIEKIMRGMEILGGKYGLTLIGGETVFSQKINISVIVIGTADNPIYRKGASPGNYIYITGEAGWSYLALNSLKMGRKTEFDHYHLRPEPKIHKAFRIKKLYNPTAMIDLSDGLIQDASHIAEESDVAIKIETGLIPMSKEKVKFSKELGINPQEATLYGGEDFELLFTSKIKQEEEGIKIIGRIEDGRGIYLDGKRLEEIKGYNHFG